MHSPECTTGWPPGRKCHCAACCGNFSTVGNFDKHRSNGQCLDPVEAGLELNDRGIWRKPGEEDIRERFKRN